MGYEELPPGHVITPHRHLSADEIIFVYRGWGVATVGERRGCRSSTALRSTFRATSAYHPS